MYKAPHPRLASKNGGVWLEHARAPLSKFSHTLLVKHQPRRDSLSLSDKKKRRKKRGGESQIRRALSFLSIVFFLLLQRLLRSFFFTLSPSIDIDLVLVIVTWICTYLRFLRRSRVGHSVVMMVMVVERDGAQSSSGRDQICDETC